VAAQAGGEGSTSTTTSDTALDAAARRAGRRKAVAQASLFDLANEKVIADLRTIDPDNITPEEAKELLKKLRDRSL
jgi:predicted Zn-dependent protease